MGRVVQVKPSAIVALTNVYPVTAILRARSASVRRKVEANRVPVSGGHVESFGSLIVATRTRNACILVYFHVLLLTDAAVLSCSEDHATSSAREKQNDHVQGRERVHSESRNVLIAMVSRSLMFRGFFWIALTGKGKERLICSSMISVVTDRQLDLGREAEEAEETRRRGVVIWAGTRWLSFSISFSISFFLTGPLFSPCSAETSCETPKFLGPCDLAAATVDSASISPYASKRGIGGSAERGEGSGSGMGEETRWGFRSESYSSSGSGSDSGSESALRFRVRLRLLLWPMVILNRDSEIMRLKFGRFLKGRTD